MTLYLPVGLALIGTVIGAYGSLFLKKGSDDFNHRVLEQLTNFRLHIGILLYVVSTVFFLAALKMTELSLIYPVTSFTYIWISFISIKHLDEDMNKFKWLGIILIIMGVFLVTR